MIRISLFLLAVLLAFPSYYFIGLPVVHLATLITNIFVSFLKLVSLPIVFLSVITALSGIEDFNKLKPILKCVVFYTMLTTLIAATTALLLYLVINPINRDLAFAGQAIDIRETSYSAHVLSLIPSNFMQTFLDNNIIGAVIIAFLFGCATLKLDNGKKKILHDFFQALFDGMIQVAKFILVFLPVALWGFIIIVIGDASGLKEFSSLLLYLLCVVLANLVQAIVILPSLLKVNGVSPLATFKGAMPALALAFFSKSSNITLPKTISCAQENLKISKKISNFSLPLCSTINMNACAAFILITVLFVSESNGFHFSLVDYVMWIGLSTIAAVGNAGVPMGCYFISTTFLIAMGVPLNIMAIILPFYSVIDMLETSINVWSDICVTVITDRKQGLYVDGRH